MKNSVFTDVVAGTALLGLFLFGLDDGTSLVSVLHADQRNGAGNENSTKIAENKRDENASAFLEDRELFPKFMTEKTSCSFADTPLTGAIEYFANRHQFSVKLDEKSLSMVGIASDTPLNLNLSDITLEEVLHLLLHPIQLGWRVEGDLVIVTTDDALKLAHSTRHYDLTRALQLGHRLEEIERAVVEASHHGWAHEGTGTGRITAFNDTLIIRQTYSAHREIVRVLNAINAPQRVTPIVSRSNDKTIRSALSDLSECQFADTPLADAVQFLSTQAEIPILIDQAALDSAAVTYDSPVSLTLTRKPLAQVLRVMLDEFQLTTVLRDGVLLVTTQDEARILTDIVVYDVAPLVVDCPLMCAVGHDLAERSSANDEKLQALAALVVDATNADDWEINGGMGRIVALNSGLLVIRANQTLHDEIAKLLNRLHAKAATTKKKLVAAKPAEPMLVVRSYLLSMETATDLSNSLRDLVVPQSWMQAVGGELPSIHVIASEPILTSVEGYIVGGQVEIRMPDSKSSARVDSRKPIPLGPTGPVKSTLVKPRAHLVIRQTPQNLLAIERFIRNLPRDGSVWQQQQSPTNNENAVSR